MQLNDSGAGSIAVAALALLAGTPAAQAQEASPPAKTWSFDFGTLVYAESGGRVQAVEPKLRVDHDLGNDRGVGATVTLDVVSGASPNGAAPAAQPQTFSGSSSAKGYTVPAYTLPMDPNFSDQREALELDYRFALGLRDRLSVSGNFSTEHDYQSLGGGLRWAHEFNQGNTTLGAGVNYSHDTVSPIGGAPTPLSQMKPPGSGDEGGEGGGGEGGEDGSGGGTSLGPANEGKQVFDAMLGVTQLLSPRSLVQFNYSLDRSSGYLVDPYKILSVVTPAAVPLYYVYEARPNQRLKQSAYLQYKHFVLGSDVVDLSYRFMTDDWGIRSHTFDLSYRWNMTPAVYAQPHLRWYRQNQADFYHAALDQGQETQLQYASADPRLGAFSAYTAGMQFGGSFGSGHAWKLRLEYYSQKGQVTGLPPAAGAALSQFDLAPSLSAVWLMAGFNF